VTLVSVVAPSDRQGQVAGSLQTAVALGAVIGPALGGLLGPAIGLDLLVLSVAAASAVGALCVLAFAQEDAGQRQQREVHASFKGLARGTLRDLAQIWQNPRMRGALTLIFVLQFGLGATNPLLELHVGDLAGATGAEAARLTGALFSVMALVNIVGLPLWGRFGDRRGHSRGLTICALSSAAALALHGLAPWLWLLFVARALLGGPVAGISPLAFGLAATEIAVERRGGAIGAVFSARTLALSTSAMAGGYLSRFVGIRGLFLCGAALVALSLINLRRPR
jgi:DHA1 family multidrug resistance protein-like MFS transporter